jgi:hypothetical protein
MRLVSLLITGVLKSTVLRKKPKKIKIENATHTKGKRTVFKATEKNKDM